MEVFRNPCGLAFLYLDVNVTRIIHFGLDLDDDLKHHNEHDLDVNLDLYICLDLESETKPAPKPKSDLVQSRNTSHLTTNTKH